MKCKNYWENAFEINLTSWQDHGADVKIVVVKGHPLEAFITTSSLWYLAIFFFEVYLKGEKTNKNNMFKSFKILHPKATHIYLHVFMWSTYH